VLEDEWLAVRCQLGERDAFDELIARWQGPLWGYVRRVTGEDDAAQDIVQDVWLRVLRGIGRLREPSRLRPWLFGIARRAVVDRWRERYADPVDSAVDPASLPVEQPVPDLENDLDSLEQEVGRLPLLEREVVSLFYLRELSLAEVAEVLGVPVGTVKSRLFRARQSLRRELQAKEKGA
jgi:RNA polymerase sigma factor (sigma-70 family)